jgi:uncharacterized protein (DUF362 family)
MDVFRSQHPSYTKEHAQFLECVEKSVQPKVTVNDGVALVKTLTEIIELFQGKTFPIPQSETVAILRAGNNIEATIQNSIDLLGGLSNVKKDSMVVIKPNVCYPKNLENMVITDLKVLESVIKIMKRRAKNVMVVESDARSGTAEKRLKDTGVMEVIEKCNAKFFNLSHDEVEEHKVSNLSIPIPKTILKADYFINLAKVKTNLDVFISIAMKNLFGVIASKRKTQFHSKLSDVLVYLNQTVCQHLIIADGIVAMEGLGPINGKPVDLGLIISGKNPVTVDAACCHVMGFNPYAVETLWKAHQQGMGEIDREKIHFLGENLSSVQRKFVNPILTRQNLIQALRTEFRLRFHK